MDNAHSGAAPTRDEFLAVWKRVAPHDSPIALNDTPPLAPQTTAYHHALQAQILREQVAAAALGMLSRRCRGGTKVRLAALAQDSARHARLLCAEAFVLTGDGQRRSGTLPAAQLPDDTAHALRMCYLALQAVHAAYPALAQAARDAGVQALCDTLGQDTARQITAVRGLLSQKIASHSPL